MSMHRLIMRAMLLAALFLGPAMTLAMAQTKPVRGVLLLAHGGSAEWNARVNDVAAAVNAQHPTEVALGMASRASIQAAIERLAARGVTEIVAVPLFVSSHSSVIASTEYLLGLREAAPDDLKMFAKMDHGAGGSHADHGDHDGAALTIDPLARVVSPVPVRMAAALDHHPLVGEILIDRARAISETPASEAVILVAHGPTPDDDNQLWLQDLAALAAQVRAATPFAAVDYLTVRDDAAAPVRDAATAQLRAKVEQQIAAGHRVLIVPVLLSYGGIENGIKSRLEGLTYTMADRALIPDDRIARWVLRSVD
jgi:sirohydrochlorin ferrochelatase